MINIIAAMTNDGLIGEGDGLPWNIPSEMQHFRKVTMGHTVVVGPRTFYGSLGGKELDGRNNIVFDRNRPEYFSSVSNIIGYNAMTHRQQIFAIGGRSVFKEFFRYADRFYLSLIRGEYAGNVYFPYSKDEIFAEFPNVSAYSHNGDWDFFLLDRFNLEVK